MKRDLCILVAAVAVAAIPAVAKLPPPPPEERAAAEDKRAREQAQLEREKLALERAQDRVAERYRQEKSRNPTSASAQRTNEESMPKTARELPRSAGPQGGREQSAEAHSAPAK